MRPIRPPKKDPACVQGSVGRSMPQGLHCQVQGYVAPCARGSMLKDSIEECRRTMSFDFS